MAPPLGVKTPLGPPDQNPGSRLLRHPETQIPSVAVSNVTESRTLLELLAPARIFVQNFVLLSFEIFHHLLK